MGPRKSKRALTPILLKSIAIHLPFLSRYFCKSMPPLLAESSIYTTYLYHGTAPSCIAILLQKRQGSLVKGESNKESTVSNTELGEFCGPHRVPGRELSELLSAYDLRTKSNSPIFLRSSPSLPQNSVSSLFRKCTLETVFHPFPTKGAKMSTKATLPFSFRTHNICWKEGRTRKNAWKRCEEKHLEKKEGNYLKRREQATICLEEMTRRRTGNVPKRPRKT